MSHFQGIAGWLVLLALLGVGVSAIDHAVGVYGGAVQMQALAP